MFLFGILSSPLPYLLMAVFYFFGFATGMFKGNADSEPAEQVVVKNIQFEPQAKNLETAESTFQFQDHNANKKVDYQLVQSTQTSAFCEAEKLIYFVHDIKVHHPFISEYYFSRPPPSFS